MSGLAKARTAIRRAQARLRGELVTITDAESISAEMVRAVRGRTLWSTERPRRGVVLGEQSTDWIIEAALFSQLTGEPQRGWKIATAHGETFHVMPFGKDKVFWSWVDPNVQTFRRIHSKDRSGS